MSFRHDGRRAYPRRDRAERDLVLKAMMYELTAALTTNLNLVGYYYWSLIDNYEWGSFEPRFGLFGLEYQHQARRRNTDIRGINAAGAYKLFVEAFRAKQKTLRRQAFQATHYPVLDLG